MYASRRYLREKYDSLKWDIEKVLDIYNEDKDQIPEDDINAVKGDIKDRILSIANELGISL